MATPHRLSTRTVDDAFVGTLIALMEKGTPPWRREWNANGGGHHVNLISGRRYRGSNPILLTLALHQQGVALPYWCGVVEAKARGLMPKPGCQLVTVVRPHGRRGEQDASDNQANPSSRMRYGPVDLVNVEHLEGDARAGLIAIRQAAEALESRPEPERLAKAEAQLRSWPVPVRHGGTRAFYNPQADLIHLPDRGAFHSSAALYATWAHEALHSTGHPSRLGRDLSGGLGSKTYAREELVAELGALLLGDRLEIGSDVSNHVAYLAEWIQLLRESPMLLYKLLSEARRAVDAICPPLKHEMVKADGRAEAP